MLPVPTVFALIIFVLASGQQSSQRTRFVGNKFQTGVYTHGLSPIGSGLDQYQMGMKLARGLPPQAPGCVVGKKGLVREVKNPQQLNVLFPANLTISAKELHLETPNTNKTYPLAQIMLPIATWPDAQSCFALKFHPENNHLLCANSPLEQRTWIASIYEALYCIHSGRVATKYDWDEGEETKELPKKTTKDDRWKQYEGNLVQTADTPSTTAAPTTTATEKAAPASGEQPIAKPTLTIEISSLDKTRPDVMVNGVPVNAGVMD